MPQTVDWEEDGWRASAPCSSLGKIRDWGHLGWGRRRSVGGTRPRRIREGQVTIKKIQKRLSQSPVRICCHLCLCRNPREPCILVAGSWVGGERSPIRLPPVKCPTEVTRGHTWVAHPVQLPTWAISSGPEGPWRHGRKSPSSHYWWTEQNKPEVSSQGKQLVANPMLLHVFKILKKNPKNLPLLLKKFVYCRKMQIFKKDRVNLLSHHPEKITVSPLGPPRHSSLHCMWILIIN